MTTWTVVACSASHGALHGGRSGKTGSIVYGVG
jgi:hypothetical protein